MTTQRCAGHAHARLNLGDAIRLKRELIENFLVKRKEVWKSLRETDGLLTVRRRSASANSLEGNTQTETDS